jgi:hypothetical protein
MVGWNCTERSGREGTGRCQVLELTERVRTKWRHTGQRELEQSEERQEASKLGGDREGSERHRRQDPEAMNGPVKSFTLGPERGERKGPA